MNLKVHLDIQNTKKSYYKQEEIISLCFSNNQIEKLHLYKRKMKLNIFLKSLRE